MYIIEDRTKVINQRISHKFINLIGQKLYTGLAPHVIRENKAHLTLIATKYTRPSLIDNKDLLIIKTFYSLRQIQISPMQINTTCTKILYPLRQLSCVHIDIISITTTSVVPLSTHCNCLFFQDVYGLIMFSMYRRPLSLHRNYVCGQYFYYIFAIVYVNNTSV